MEKLTNFEFSATPASVEFVETTHVEDGVLCDVYRIVGDDTKDLAIVTVAADANTPLQRVLAGEHTIEGFLSGRGTLAVIDDEGNKQEYSFPDEAAPNEVEVMIGQTMQWTAAMDSELRFYEICTPPYQDGRFENIEA